MQRPIKFRAWSKITSTMILDYGVDTDWDRVTLNSILEGNQYDSDYPTEPVFMQYTGLKDRHGKEIYEGDIVKTEHGATGIVKWLDEKVAFGFDTSEPMWSHPIDGMNGEKEVIGNIYENSNLIKGEEIEDNDG